MSVTKRKIEGYGWVPDLPDPRDRIYNLEETIQRAPQLPPKFSAKKIAGVPAYKLARKKHEVELKSVRVWVHRFDIQQIDGDRASFIADVSAGTYIRSLAHDLGQKLGIGAHVAELRRTAAHGRALD